MNSLATAVTHSTDTVSAATWSAVAGVESQRQRNIVILAGHLAMILLVVVALVASLGTYHQKFSAGSLTLLLAGAAAFVAWSLYGTRDVFGYYLWQKGGPPSTNGVAN